MPGGNSGTSLESLQPIEQAGARKHATTRHVAIPGCETESLGIQWWLLSTWRNHVVLGGRYAGRGGALST